MRDPYSETPETDDALITTWLEKGEAFADKHTRTALGWMYAATIVCIWFAGLMGRHGPLPSGEIYGHTVVAGLHACVALLAGGFAIVTAGDPEPPSARIKLTCLAVAASAVVMVVVESLLP